MFYIIYLKLVLLKCKCGKKHHTWYLNMNNLRVFVLLCNITLVIISLLVKLSK